ncbi:unnamed protein product [Rhodiola kirilowii]
MMLTECEAVKKLNYDMKAAGENHILDLHEVEEIRMESYESDKLYKERSKKRHDRKLRAKHFSVGEKMLLYKSKLKLFTGKLKSRWVNGHTLKEYFGYKPGLQI